MREGVINLIESIAKIAGIKDLSLTTNAVLLKRYAADLRSAGIKRINVSLDTLNIGKFKSITKRDCFNDVITGIDNAISSGLDVKLNVVVIKGVNDDEILDFISFAQRKEIIIRFIEFMPISFNHYLNESGYMPGCDIMRVVSRLGNLICLDGVSSDAARYYKIDGFRHPVGFINAISEKFCSQCSRLRLSARGELFPCLGSNIRVDLKRALRNKSSNQEIIELIKKVVYYKPREHSLLTALRKNTRLYRAMSEIGG